VNTAAAVAYCLLSMRKLELCQVGTFTEQIHSIPSALFVPRYLNSLLCSWQGRGEIEVGLPCRYVQGNSESQSLCFRCCLSLQAVKARGNELLVFSKLPFQRLRHLKVSRQAYSITAARWRSRCCTKCTELVLFSFCMRYRFRGSDR